MSSTSRPTTSSAAESAPADSSATSHGPSSMSSGTNTASDPTEVGKNSDGLVRQPHGGALKPGGNPGGRPKVKEESVAAIRAGLPEVLKTLIKKAISGDAKAIELCLHYGIGKPTDRLEVSGPEGGPVQFEETMSDHEKRALRDAIRSHLASGVDTESEAARA